jgi:fumarate reductase iron-sulfur subunit
MANAPNIIEIEVLRYRPEQDKEPVPHSFMVPYSEDMSILQALQHIKDDMDGSLSFRWSCRMAICGSCGMMVNGKPHLSCQTFVRDFLPGPVKIEALAHFPIVRDVMVDVEPFIAKLESVKPWIIPREERALAQGEYLQTPEQMAQFEQFSGCINCMLCYAACPQFGLDNEFLGPGVLALLHRYNADSRDGGKRERMQLVNAEDGVWGCTLLGYCYEVCPKRVDPARAVNQNKINSTKDYFFLCFKP